MRLTGVRDWFGGGRPEAQEAPVALPVAAPPPAAGPPPRWPMARLAAVQALWGDGFISPGGAAETLRLAKPFGLTSSNTLLLLGAGLGGPAHAIAAASGAWVSSHEADPDLAAVAERRRQTLETAGRVTVGAWDRAAPEFRPRSAHHALLLEPLRGAAPEALVASLAQTLRPAGQVVLTELVSDTPLDPNEAETAAWCRLENRAPTLSSEATVTGALTEAGFDVRVVEDLSDRHVHLTLSGWRAAVQAMDAQTRPSPQLAASLVTEAELWLLRIRIMRRLGVRLLRWHAIGG